MARSNILDTRTMDFGELVGNGKVYRVPPYQRDYSWTEEHWEDLWSDITDLRLRPSDSHYMGAVMIEPSADREFQIIDGQQRTATLSILCLAVIARLHDLARKGNEPERNASRASELRRAFIGDRDPASLIEHSKLFLNQADDPFYQDYLVQLREPRNARRLPKSNLLLWNCFTFFHDRIETLDFRDDGEALARFLTETVSRQLLFIVITVDDEINAYTVFETLNARGTALTTTDLLKNYLFSRVAVTADLEALKRRWRALIATVSAERFPEFLRYHLQTEQPQVRSQGLFKVVRERARTPAEVFQLLDALETRAELFAALSDPTHGYWVEWPEARPSVRELSLFGARQMTPLLFAAHEVFDRDRFVSTLRATAVLMFRYLIVSDLNPNALELPFHRGAKAILEREAATPSAVAALLAPIYVDDDRFRHDFSLLSMDTKGQRKRLVKYILARLESDLAGRSVDPDTDPGTIEHILPEHPGDDWDAAFSIEEQDAYVYRLGNLTLLEASANRSAGSASYVAKVAAYDASTYAITRRIPRIAPSEWTPELIQERQREMAIRATHAWRSDFA